MKKILLLSLVLLSLASCRFATRNVEGTTETVEDEDNVQASDRVSVTTFNNLYRAEIDGCEYIVFIGVERGGIVHHESCDNVNHRPR